MHKLEAAESLHRLFLYCSSSLVIYFPYLKKVCHFIAEYLQYGRYYKAPDSFGTEHEELTRTTWCLCTPESHTLSQVAMKLTHRAGLKQDIHRGRYYLGVYHL